MMRSNVPDAQMSMEHKCPGEEKQRAARPAAALAKNDRLLTVLASSEPIKTATSATRRALVQ